MPRREVRLEVVAEPVVVEERVVDIDEVRRRGHGHSPTSCADRVGLAAPTRPAGRDAAATERVDPTPAPGDVEQLEMADPARQRRIDDEVLAVRLEAEHRAEQEERRSRRPRLRAARGRVLHRVFRLLARIPAERLGQTAVEELGRVQDAGGDSAASSLKP